MKTKKELKESYKQYKPVMGVFQVRNTVNGKVLIDSSKDVLSKWNRHQTELRFGSHRKKELQNDWTALGSENFTFEILSELKYAEKENINYSKEVELLKEMVPDANAATSSAVPADWVNPR